MKLKKSPRPIPFLVLSLAAIALLTSTGFVAAENAVDRAPSSNSVEEPSSREVSSDALSYQMYYFFAAGSALHSVDSAMGSNYNSGGCINATANPFDYFTIYLHLPQGSRIDYLRIYYYDTSGSNSTAYLNKYDGAANTTFLTEVSSAGNTGFGTQLSPYLGHIVDNGNGSYVLGWIPNVTGTSMQLCGLRVAYRLPVKNAYLPVVVVRR
jgi:hypothetical protein